MTQRRRWVDAFLKEYFRHNEEQGSQVRWKRLGNVVKNSERGKKGGGVYIFILAMKRQAGAFPPAAGLNRKWP